MPTYPLFIHVVKVCSVHHFLRWARGCPVSFTFPPLHSLILVKHTIHAPHHFCLYSYFFSLVYRTGAFGWIDAVQVSKNSFSRFSSVDRFVVHGGHRSRVLSLLCFTYRTVQYSYIYCSVGRLSIEPYCRYIIFVCLVG
jgi:hypothetical protein